MMLKRNYEAMDKVSLTFAALPSEKAYNELPHFSHNAERYTPITSLPHLGFSV